MKKGEEPGGPSPSKRFAVENLGPPSPGSPSSTALFRCLNRHVYTDELAAELAVAERDGATGKREEGMVLAHADIGARIIFGAALAHDDVAAGDALAAELLHAETTARAVAAVA